jgi:purine nucleoside phosphorylase
LPQVDIGIIGGSGLYSMPGLSEVREVPQTTPFGEPSDPYILGTLEGRKVAFLARHGRGHRILPSELNFRANIYGFKQLGVERIVSVSAVGSLKEEHKPLDFVIPDQFFDRTRHRVDTFFGTESWRTSLSPIRCVPNLPSWWKAHARKRASLESAAVLIYAWKALNFPRKPSRTYIEVGAWTLSA